MYVESAVDGRGCMDRFAMGVFGMRRTGGRSLAVRTLSPWPNLAAIASAKVFVSSGVEFFAACRPSPTWLKKSLIDAESQNQ
jgi:hypothetical protein